MTTLITIIHVAVCVFLILVILLQAGKDAGMGAAFGGGGSGTVFGGRGAGSFLGKVTGACAAIFFLTSLTLSFAASQRASVTDLVADEAPAAAPATTETPAAPAGEAAPAAPEGSAAPTEAAPSEAAPPEPAPAQ